MKPRVFISYARADLAFADRLAEALKARGFETLIDRSEIYAFEDWWKRIEALIVRADAVAFVLSPDSAASEVCGREVAFAASLNKRLAPIVVRRVDDKKVPEALRRLNFIFFEETGEFDARLVQLAEALSTDIDWVRKHTEIGEAARRWSAAGRPGPRGLLLRSPMLEEAERWIASRPPGAPLPTDETQALLIESRRAATNRRNTLTGILAAGLLVALVLTGIAYRQRQIAIQNEERAVAAETQAKAERDQALLTQSRFLADLSSQRVNQGDAGTAILFALEALPDLVGRTMRPYSAEAETSLFIARQRLQERYVLSHEGPVYSVALGQDDHYAVTASAEKIARLWDTQTGRIIALLQGSAGRVQSVRFGPGDKRIVTISDDRTVQVWETASGRLITTLVGHTAAVNGVAFSPDGRRLVTTSNDKTARVWDAESGQAIAIFRDHSGFVSFGNFSPDGVYVVTTSDDGARIWIPETGQTSKLLSDPTLASDSILNSVREAQFSPSGRQVATVSIDNTVRLWDPETGQVIVRFKSPSLTDHVSFSPDGQKLATHSSTDNTVRIWDAESGQVISVLSHGGYVPGAVFSNDGQRMLTGSWDKAVRVWDVAAGKPTIVLGGHDDIVWRALFSRDGTRLLTASNDRTARIWDIADAQAVASLGIDGPAARFSPDGTRVVTYGSLSSDARVLNFPSGTQIAVLKALRSSNYAAFSADGRRVVTANDQTAQIWDAETGRTIAILEGHGGYVYSSNFSPDGRLVVTASHDKTARIWDSSSGKLITTLEGHKDYVTSAAFSPDGKRVLTAASSPLSDDPTARIWDTETGRTILVLSGHNKSVNDAVFSPDGRRVVTASSDNTARIWDAQTGRTTAVLRGHSREVKSVAFSLEGRRVVTSSGDTDTRIWDADTGNNIAVIKGFASPWGSRAEFRDERHIVTISSGAIRTWRIYANTQELVDEAKQLVPRCLTSTQRVASFLKSEPPAWCIEMSKWPYQTQDWKDWLSYKRADANPPFPDSLEWLSWIKVQSAK